MAVFEITADPTRGPVRLDRGQWRHLGPKLLNNDLLRRSVLLYATHCAQWLPNLAPKDTHPRCTAYTSCRFSH